MAAQPAEREARSADGTRIGFVELGSGPPLILVHGGVSDGGQWLPVAQAMSGTSTCFLMDRRGRGRSGDAAGYSLEREAEDIKAVLDAAGPDANLLGHSYGAICALEAACRFPVRRLVLYEPPLLFVGPRSEQLVERFRAAVESHELGEALALFLKEGPQLPEADVAALQQTPLWEEMAALAPTLTREMEAINGLGGNLERYHELSVPTLLLLGSLSASHLEAASKGLQETLPDARTVLLDGQAHVANLTAPDLVAREVTGFLLARP